MYLAATALVIGATNLSLSIGPYSPESLRAFVEQEERDYIGPSGLCGPECVLTAVYAPQQLFPLTGLNDLPLDASIAVGTKNLDACLRGQPCIATSPPYAATVLAPITDSAYVVSGGSQGALIASRQKAALIADPISATVNFVLTSNQSRPNGGILQRFKGAYIPVVGIDFIGATPTNSSREAPLLTVDYARQYDGWVDFPTNPLNALATVNAVLGMFFLHANYLFEDSAPLLQGHYQDTTYYLGATSLLPLVMPIAALPVIGLPLARALDAPLRVLVEAGYDRTINPGQPSLAQYLYFPDPVKTFVDVVAAIPVGWDDAIGEVTGNPANRPFGTNPPSTFGVGGPPVYAGAVDPYDVPTVEPSVRGTGSPVGGPARSPGKPARGGASDGTKSETGAVTARSAAGVAGSLRQRTGSQ